MGVGSWVALGEQEAGVNVRVERDGAVTTVIIDRPEVRNAVDGATAA
jgi:enoyl-CoA hydratase